MKKLSMIADNITEILVKIIKFTQTRHKILSQNLDNIRTYGFIPKDLEVDEFSEVLDTAISEYVQNRRLLFYDTKNIKFGTAGTFEVEPVVDEYAQELLGNNQDEYLELQINKLLENSLNQKIAKELLKQRQGVGSVFD